MFVYLAFELFVATLVKKRHNHMELFESVAIIEFITSSETFNPGMG
jgi:hypothetical protein